MFERFTERARQVIVLAQEEARGLKHDYIGSEHLLLGICREEEGIGARVLASLDTNAPRVREQVERIVGRGEEAPAGPLPFTPRAKKMCELALREALSLGHNYIGTEHLLLGVVREGEGVAARILLDFDVDSERVRNEVIRILSVPKQAAAPVKGAENAIELHPSNVSQLFRENQSERIGSQYEGGRIRWWIPGGLLLECEANGRWTLRPVPPRGESC